jgi:hypothetical protein
LRKEHAETSRLAWAFAISVALHLVFFGGYYGGKKLHVWENLRWPTWLKPVQTLVEAFQKKPAPETPKLQEPPLMFVEVSPAQATAEPPKNATFYSSQNSKAANPEIKKPSNLPQISGNQTQVPKTQSTPRTEYKPLQPTPPPQVAPKGPVEQEQQKPKAAEPPGDLALAKPDPKPAKDPGDAPRERRPTISELRAQQQARLMPGDMMKQEGGVQRHAEISSVDAKATPFGAYDWALVAAIQSRWYALLDERSYASDGKGKVVLHFTLHHDGRITDMSIAETTVTEVLGILCEKAVLDPAPFQAWPAEMRKMMGETRNIQITFYYN